jgi:hypothetical protein
LLIVTRIIDFHGWGWQRHPPPLWGIFDRRKKDMSYTWVAGRGTLSLASTWSGWTAP